MENNAINKLFICLKTNSKVNAAIKNAKGINKNLSSEIGIIFYQPEIENKTLNFFYFTMTTTI